MKIFQEDSDDLRSGQSSRGSSNRFGTGRAPSQTAAPEVDARFVEILKEEEVDSDGVEITELPSESSASVKGSEEESVKEEAEEVATPTVPKLLLTEKSEEEEKERDSKTEDKTPSPAPSSSSETDTVLESEQKQPRKESDTMVSLF